MYPFHSSLCCYCAAAFLTCLSGTVGAAVLFTETFDINGGTLNGGPNGQVTTTHDLVFNAALTGWTNSGTSTIHGVDTANTWTGGVVTTSPRNWGVMIWANALNVITQSAGIASSNTVGQDYRIDFLGGYANYQASSQANDGTTDGLKIEVLRASDNAILHTFNQVVGNTASGGNLQFDPYNFTYTGDSSGDIKFRVSGINAGASRFQGTIDNLQLSSIPEPSTTLLGGLGVLLIFLRRR